MPSSEALGLWGVLRGLHLGPSILDEETKVQREAGTCCNHTTRALMCPHLKDLRTS